jgi:hypothetical protein
MIKSSQTLNLLFTVSILLLHLSQDLFKEHKWLVHCPIARTFAFCALQSEESRPDNSQSIPPQSTPKFLNNTSTPGVNYILDKIMYEVDK